MRLIEHYLNRDLLPQPNYNGYVDPLQIKKYYEVLRQQNVALAQDFSMSKFKSIVNSQIPAESGRLRDMITQFCAKDGEPELVEVRKVTLMAEAVIFMPHIISKDKNQSMEMSHVMNDITPLANSFFEKNWLVGRPKSRTKVSQVISRMSEEDQAKAAESKNLEVICILIQQKFESLLAAFRYFDVNSRQKVTIRDFNSQLAKLKIQMPVSDIISVFSFADTNKRGFIDIHDFKALFYYKPHLLTTQSQNQLQNSQFFRMQVDMNQRVLAGSALSESGHHRVNRSFAARRFTHGIPSLESDNMKEVVEHAFISSHVKTQEDQPDDYDSVQLDPKRSLEVYKAPKIKDYSMLFKFKARDSSNKYKGRRIVS